MDPLLKMFHNPGGDWHPGRGDNPTYHIYSAPAPKDEEMTMKSTVGTLLYCSPDVISGKADKGVTPVE